MEGLKMKKTESAPAPLKAKRGKTKRMGMFLQDPIYSDLHEDYLFPLDRDFLFGTGSSRFLIRDADERDLPLYPGLQWDRKGQNLSFQYFEEQGLIDNPQFHQVNTFAVLSHNQAWIEEELGEPVVWRGHGPLVVRPHAFQGQNAYYYSEPQCLNFGYFSSPFRRAPLWTCLSHDVVSHELGHAILDAIRPLFMYTGDPDTNALHESLADLLAMFSALEHTAVLEDVYKETGQDMRNPSIVTRLAEEFGVAIFGAGEPYLRSALEGPPYDNAPKEVHARSTVWTAAMYDLLERLVGTAIPPESRATFGDFCVALAEAVKWIKGMLFRTLHYMPPAAVSMPMFARLMYNADAHVFPEDPKFRDLAKKVFVSKKHGLWNDNLDLTAPDIGTDFQALESADAATLSRAIMKHAEALRIPKGPGIRLLTPRIITTTRMCDRLNAIVRPITEHYLEYAYEQIEIIPDPQTGELVAVAVYGGGTLVIDEQWKAKLLATYPEIHKDDPGGNDGSLRAWARARDRFVRGNRRAIEANLAERDRSRNLKDPPVVPGCPVLLIAPDVGPYRIVRRLCNLREHVLNIRYMK